MQEKVLNDVKKEIRSVLITFQKGVNLDEFLKAYKDLLGQWLPFRALGFTSEVEFLKSIPDVVHVSINGIGRILLTGIADENTEHIQKLVSRQRLNKSNNKPNKKRQRSRQPFGLPKGRKHTPFVPGPVRAEIIQLTAMYPDGITFSAFVLAYHKKYNKYLSLERGIETLKDMINTISDLEIKLVKSEEKIFLKNSHNKSMWITDQESQKSQASRCTEDYRSQLTCHNQNSTIDKSGIPEAVQKNFQMVLEKCPEGILTIHFPVLYEKLTGMSFDLLELGYDSILELVDALPWIFKRLLDSSNDKDWIILSANSPITHIDHGQKINKNTKNKMSRKSPSPMKFHETLPSDAASPLVQYIPPLLPQSLSLNNYFPVFVSAVVSPALFWFQLQTLKAIETLENLEKELMDFYSKSFEEYKMFDKDIVTGATCVTFCQEDQHWYRAVIKSIPSIDFVNVFFVDFGSRQNVSRKQLYYLRSKFSDCPSQAYEAKLCGLKPLENASWNIRCQQRFIELCETPSLMAYLNSVNKGTFSVYLCDTSGEHDLHINDLLIEEGYAELTIVNNSSDMLYSHVAKPCVDTIHETSATSSNIASPVVNGFPHSFPPNHQFQALATTEKYIPMESDELIVKRKLFSSNERQSGDDNSLNSSVEECNKRYVKQVKLCENNQIHIINFNNKPYATPGDLSKLFWKEKNSSYLAERLKYKETEVPALIILKEDNIELFKQCEWYKLPDLELNSFSLTLFPLEWAFKILNIFGHPSVCLRLVIQNEIRTFDPLSSMWKDFKYPEFQEISEIEEKLERLCLYDLKAKYEAMKIKRLKLLQRNCPSHESEIQEIEHLLFVISKRIEYISSICSQYSSL